ncbi:MAG: hypothetical protein ACN2B6_05300 [Rickettsiales bacterium]
MSSYTIYKENIIEELEALSSYEFQRIAWFENDQGISYLYNEIVSDLFDDFHLDEALDDQVIIFSNQADNALRELREATDKIDGNNYPESKLIDLPNMQIVREKAAKALALIQASDGSESTVEIIE